MKVIAIDWSGRVKRSEEAIWRAVVHNGRLNELENGMTREEVIDWLLNEATGDHPVVAGLDFAFSFPRWFCEEHGWKTHRDVCDGVGDLRDVWLESCPSPFWGIKGSRAPDSEHRFRKTEFRIAGATPKSVFQLGGAGAVGKGSIVGISLLGTLRQQYSIWPFDPPSDRTIIEIYPRLFTGAVTKNAHQHRRHFLGQFADESPGIPAQDPVLLERAAGSEDAFDAAVSAIRMWQRRDELAQLQRASDVATKLEGSIFTTA